MVKRKSLYGVSTAAGRIGACAVIFGVFVSAGGPALAQSGEYRAVVDRMERLERELVDLQQVTYGAVRGRDNGRRSAQPAAVNTSPAAIANLTVRLSELEKSLAGLTGRLEQLEYRTQQIEQRMNQLSQLSAAGQSPTQLGGVNPGAPSGAVTLPGGVQGTPAQQPYGQGAAQQPQAQQSQQAARAQSQPRGPVQLSGNEDQDFAAARDLLTRGEFARAQSIFEAFAQTYPKSEKSGEALFWAGEALFVRDLFQEAAQAYLKSARDYPKGSKAPDSLLKLSLSFDRMGERKQACAALAQLNQRYPKASERVRQNAQRFGRDYGC